MTADKTFGSMSEAPRWTAIRSGAWRLWETLAQGRPQFGNPSVFDSHIDESSWESYTVTMKDPIFFELIKAFSGSEPGNGGLITFKDSNWLITISIFHQPFIRISLRRRCLVGLRPVPRQAGDYVKKTMAECSGKEILEEVLGHLSSTSTREKILAASN